MLVYRIIANNRPYYIVNNAFYFNPELLINPGSIQLQVSPAFEIDDCITQKERNLYSSGWSGVQGVTGRSGTIGIQGIQGNYFTSSLNQPAKSVNIAPPILNNTSSNTSSNKTNNKNKIRQFFKRK